MSDSNATPRGQKRGGNNRNNNNHFRSPSLYYVDDDRHTQEAYKRNKGRLIEHNPYSDLEEFPDESSLFIGDLSRSVTEEMLRKEFEHLGDVEVDIKRDKVTKNNLGYGFVKFRNRLDAERAKRKMNGFEIGGRAIRIGWAQKNTNLFVCLVGDVEERITGDHLKEIFTQFGPIYEEDTFVKRNKYGFVKFKHRAHAEKAKAALDGKHLATKSGYRTAKPVRIGWGDANTQRNCVHVQFEQNSASNVDLKEEDFKQQFQKFGQVNKVSLPRYSDKRLKGYGFIHFEENDEGEESAARAITALTASQIKGVVIMCNFGKRQNQRHKRFAQKKQGNGYGGYDDDDMNDGRGGYDDNGMMDDGRNYNQQNNEQMHSNQMNQFGGNNQMNNNMNGFDPQNQMNGNGMNNMNNMNNMNSMNMNGMNDNGINPMMGMNPMMMNNMDGNNPMMSNMPMPNPLSMSPNMPPPNPMAPPLSGPNPFLPPGQNPMMLPNFGQFNNDGNNNNNPGITVNMMNMPLNGHLPPSPPPPNLNTPNIGQFKLNMNMNLNQQNGDNNNQNKQNQFPLPFPSFPAPQAAPQLNMTGSTGGTAPNTPNRSGMPGSIPAFLPPLNPMFGGLGGLPPQLSPQMNPMNKNSSNTNSPSLNPSPPNMFVPPFQPGKMGNPFGNNPMMMNGIPSPNLTQFPGLNQNPNQQDPPSPPVSPLMNAPLSFLPSPQMMPPNNSNMPPINLNMNKLPQQFGNLNLNTNQNQGQNQNQPVIHTPSIMQNNPMLGQMKMPSQDQSNNNGQPGNN